VRGGAGAHSGHGFRLRLGGARAALSQIGAAGARRGGASGATSAPAEPKSGAAAGRDRRTAGGRDEWPQAVRWGAGRSDEFWIYAGVTVMT
jgi:hypothetical protein